MVYNTKNGRSSRKKILLLEIEKKERKTLKPFPKLLE